MIFAHFLLNLFIIVGISIQLVSGQCGTAGVISVGGSTIFTPVINLWGTAYTSTCPETTVKSNATGASGGVGGVCNVPGFAPVDIGNLSRDWRPTEATTTDAIKYTCVADPSRSVIQVPVALDGIVVLVDKQSKVWTDCLSTFLQGGLTSQEIRWIFSNRSDIPQPAVSDNNNATWLWSEIHPSCPKQPILIGSPAPQYGTNNFFREVMFTASGGEGFRSAVQYFDVESADLTAFLGNNDYAIAYSGYSFLQKNPTLQSLKVDGIEPTDETLSTDQYLPFGRRIYSNIVDTAETHAKVKCFFEYALSDAGATDLDTIGFLPIPKEEWDSLKARIPGTCSGAPTATPSAAPARPGTKLPCCFICSRSRGCSFARRLFRRCTCDA